MLGNSKEKDTNKYFIKGKRYFIRFITFAYLIFMISFIGFHIYYANRILPNIYVNNIAIGGMTFEEAEVILKEKLKAEDMKLKMKIKNYEAEITTTDIEFQFLHVATAKKAFLIGRSGSFRTNIKNKLLALLNPITIMPEYKYSNSNIESLLNLYKIEALDEVKEPTYVFENDELKIINGKSGETFDQGYIHKEIIKHFIYDLDSEFVFDISIVNPTLTMQDFVRLKFDVEQILNKNYALVFQDYKWDLDKPAVLKFLKPVKKSANEASLIADKSAILDKLNEISEEIDRNPRGQILVVENGKAVNFVSSESGLRMIIKDSYDAIEKSLFDGEGIDTSEKIIQLAVEVTIPPETSNEYKVEDILGTGNSKFVGSDAGRMHNIETAATKVSGILVKPGGVFSFVEAVGPIDRNHGFTSAKVISGGRTVLGDGGGVCQVSTTVFRAALNAGLPIIERNAHSYRVSYYEQDSGPGLDATIYSPSVDLQFKNDTEGYILVVSEFSKENASLKFTIYGKSDGRAVELTKPKILSQTPPPEAKYIEDNTLPKGVKRAQEYPIWGAVVSFNRTVKKDDQILYEDTFKSGYRAWGAVYLVGTKE